MPLRFFAATTAIAHYEPLIILLNRRKSLSFFKDED